MKRIVLSIYLLLIGSLVVSQTIPCNNPTPPSFGRDVGISNVTLATLNHTTQVGQGFTMEYNSPGIDIPNLVKCVNYQLIVTLAEEGAGRAWIDWNGDGIFSEPEEFYQGFLTATNQYLYDITVPLNVTPGNKIMRVAGGVTVDPDPCSNNSRFADIEDYRINVVEDAMQIDSVVVEQINSCLFPSTSCQPILRLAVHTTGTFDPITITGFDFNTNGSTNPANDISNAKIIYIGDTSEFFSCNTTFGTLGNSPSGGFNITGNHTLIPSNCRNIHYFWLVYDISAGAISPNKIDAECSIVSTITQGNPATVIPLITAPLGNSTINSGVEICDNGLDDDCDGLIDCFDPDCAGIENCISEISDFFYGLPMDTCPAPTTSSTIGNLVTEWAHTYLDGDGRSVAIGDLDGDNVSEIVITNSGTNMAILDGKTGVIKRNVPGNYFNTHGLIADANRDGFGEIYWTTDNDEIFCYDYGTDAILWGPIAYNELATSDSPLSITDFNRDGIPELFTENYIINSTNGSLMGEFFKNPIQGHRPIAIDIYPDNYCPSCYGLEIVLGTQIFTVTINNGIANIEEILPFNSDPLLNDVSLGFRRTSTIADLDNDNLLEIVTVSNNTIFSWEPLTRTIINSVNLNSLPPFRLSNHITPVSINDIDNDGDLDFVFTSTAGNTVDQNYLIALDSDFNLIWSQEGMGEGSEASFPTIFDLNGDGNKEIIFRAEMSSTTPYIHILDAASGTKIDSIYRYNRTRDIESTVMIADVDNDGEVEIIATGFTNATQTDFELIVIGGGQVQWKCGRNVWNQHNYHPSFINDDLTIPQHQQNHVTIPIINMWGSQSSFRDTSGNYSCPLPDLNVNIDSVFSTTCDTVNATITVCNVGKKDIQRPEGNWITKYISFYSNNPLDGGTHIRTDTLGVELDTIESCISFNTNIYADNQPFNLYVVVNDSGSNPLSAPNTKITECNLNNNFGNATSNNFVNVTDTFNICDGDSILIANTYQTTSGVYIDTIQNQGCNSIISTTLIVTPRVNVILNPQEPLCLNGNAVQLNAEDTGGIWIGSGIIDSINGTFDPQIAEIGINTVAYITACNDSFFLDVNVDACNIFLPNAFTPNGDNFNETFIPIGLDISEEDYVFNIFNRWGDIIFKSTQLQEGWDGTYKGKVVQNGIYIWQLNFKDDNGLSKKITGRVTVIQ